MKAKVTFIILVVLLVEVAQAAVIYRLHADLAIMTEMEADATDAWLKYAEMADRNYEAWHDAGLSRMVRTEIESAFWPCGVRPTPVCD